MIVKNLWQIAAIAYKALTKIKRESIYISIKSQIDFLAMKIIQIDSNLSDNKYQTPGPVTPKISSGWYEFSLEKIIYGFFSFVAKTAWPIVSLIIFVLLKSQIIDLLSRLKKGRIGPAEAEFNDFAKTAKEEAKETINFEPKGISSKYISEIANNPRELVISKWVEIEIALKELVDSKANQELVSGNYMSSNRKYNVTSTIRTIQKNNLLSDNYIPMIHELRVMRNEAAHAQNFMLSPEAVATYVQIADRILFAIREALYS